MKGNTKVWLWWSFILGSNWFFWLTAKGYTNQLYNTDSPETLNFTTVLADGESYSDFLLSLREKLASGKTSHGIQLLRAESTVPESQRLIFVQLSNWAGAYITLALDVTNVYIEAFSPGNASYFQMTPFGNSYPQLEKLAAQPRAKIDLGIMALEQAISCLQDTATSQNRTLLAKSLIVITQLISEAVRFRQIEQRVRWSIRSNQRFRPDVSILSLENNWRKISAAIQESNQGGVFHWPVQLEGSKSTRFKEDTVTPQLVSNLALMLAACGNTSASCSHSNRILEPTVRLPGQNGFCIDVWLGKYNDGNKVQLWRCKNNTDVNQLWTLKRDGTIQSNGKCLTTSGFVPGSYVVIYNCTIAGSAATKWEVWENGTIINPQSGLVLAAKSATGGARLTIEPNIYATNQAWAATNNSQPFITSIVGFKDLCLQANGIGVWITECASNEAKQKWGIYADGSIRPVLKKNSCLSSDGDVGGASVSIRPCDPAGSSGQRWEFRNDGNILNLYNGMVMDVIQSDPSLEQIIIWPSTGNSNQKWLPLLL